MTPEPLSLSLLALIAFCVATETGREICFKQAATGQTGWQAIFSPVTALGIFFWFVELLAWSRVLSLVPLSLAFPIMALSYVSIAMAGTLLFKESINLRHALGIFLVTAGVVCVGVTGS
ncbi:EamA family transporter [Rhizobium paknamense]|uniref:Undecaprenyl phosphate-alpha-L-ara4N flippase subunit ArnE n=1 Tax=Rhizobium paknamense TaxID=1206817 RepID=A0ABU0IBX7_9HYPH|nr:EamA family transporter [Rhizobium paknamense]MDQ0455743.1 undecaprenyl phosphate-alpha-L-ara4N flippase subunit ArnE [Rhizobium paknamense]